MAKLKIVKDNNPVMRKRSLPVSMPLSKEDKNTLDLMLDYLKKSQDDEYAKKHNLRAGVGMAAIQIGQLKRMFVIYYETDNGPVEYQLVNPEIIETSIRKVALEEGEGCLSVDDEHKGYVHRNYKIVMKAYNALTDENIVITAKGYDAIVLQHEYDHLNGMLFYDRIDSNNPYKQLMNEQLL